MAQSYSQWRAMLAITRGSLSAILRSPSAIVFSLFFPLIFILVFGFIGSGGVPTQRIVMAPGSDTANAVYDSIKALKNVRIVAYKDSAAQRSDLIKGRITGVMSIRKVPTSDSLSTYAIGFTSTTASTDRIYQFLPQVENVVNKLDRRLYPNSQTVARLLPPKIETVRKYNTIDFILPGQLGFSLLSAGLFGVAFLFFNLRQQLVLKRFFATPIRKGYIVMGEALSRVVFQLLTAVVIIGVGHFFFGFTLINGWITFLEIMALSFFALLVFMGFGFVVSGLAKTDSSIPPLANLFTLPQFLLAGTFFSIDVFPTWLQPISRALPLTYFNDAMRRISFEGAHLTDCGTQLAVLAGWGVLAYAIAIKVFRWE